MNNGTLEAWGIIESVVERQRVRVRIYNNVNEKNSFDNEIFYFILILMVIKKKIPISDIIYNKYKII